MIVTFDIIILVFVLICAIAAISVKDLLSAVIILGAYSFSCAFCGQKWVQLM